MFDADDLRTHLVGDRDWEMVDDLQQPDDDALIAGAVTTADQMRDLDAHTERHGMHLLHHLRFSSYPQLALTAGEHVWTSVHILLRKSERPSR